LTVETPGFSRKIAGRRHTATPESNDFNKVFTMNNARCDSAPRKAPGRLALV